MKYEVVKPPPGATIHEDWIPFPDTELAYLVPIKEPVFEHPVSKRCKECGSDRVRVDAWAEWDTDTQSYVLAETFQQEFCFDCDGECTITEIPYIKGDE